MIRIDATTGDYLDGDSKANLPEYDSNFDGLVRKLRVAMIDAYMCDEGFNIERHGNYYWRLDGEISITEVTRPTGGEGGFASAGHGKIVAGPISLPGPDFVGKFSEHVATLDRWIDRFRRLPRPDGFVPVMDRLTNVANQLAVGDRGEGPMDDLFVEVEAKAALLKGDTADTYRKNFVNQFDTVLENQQSMAIALAQFLLAQKAMWEAARGDFITIVKNCTVAFDAAAEGNSPPDSFTDTALKVITAAVTAAGLIVVPESATVGWVTLAVLETAALLPEKGHVPSKFTSIRDRMLDLFQKLDAQIKAVEDQIYKNSGLDMDRVSGATAQAGDRETVRANFKLQPAYLDPSTLGRGEIAAGRRIVTDIVKCMVGGPDSYGNDVIGIIPILTKTLGMIPTADEFVAPAIRDHDVGRGHYGPMLALNELLDMFTDLVRGLRDDVQLSADNFQAAYGVLLAHGDQVVVDLQAVQARVAALQNPSGYDDPWRYDKTPAPNESFREQYIDLRRMTECPTVCAPRDAVNQDFQEIVPEFKR